MQAPRGGEAEIVFIVGPTASGKTEAAVALAAALPGAEIVNCDSRQVYRGMSIGTAKPTAAQRAAVPHHVIDVVEPDDPFSLAAYLSLARSAIADILARGGRPVVVGGTGQYAWGLAEGWEAPAVPPQPEARERLRREAESGGAAALHERLAGLDPEAARFIHPHNVRRVIRALEVIEVTGRSFSPQRTKSAPAVAARMLGLATARGDLHRRIDERIERMLDEGWLDEVRELLHAGYGPELPSFSSAGYRDLAAHLRGEATLEAAIEGVRAATRRLAKAQAAWFRRSDQRISWAADAGALVTMAAGAT